MIKLFKILAITALASVLAASTVMAQRVLSPDQMTPEQKKEAAQAAQARMRSRCEHSNGVLRPKYSIVTGFTPAPQSAPQIKQAPLQQQTTTQGQVQVQQQPQVPAPSNGAYDQLKNIAGQGSKNHDYQYHGEGFGNKANELHPPVPCTGNPPAVSKPAPVRDSNYDRTGYKVYRNTGPSQVPLPQ
jgi:hypothetical protein